MMGIKELEAFSLVERQKKGDTLMKPLFILGVSPSSDHF